ncbi:MAG: ester cyclase [Actinomycetota bacterium]
MGKSVTNSSWCSAADRETVAKAGRQKEDAMDRNKETARRLYEQVFNQRDLDALDELATPDYDEHDPLPGQGAGRDGLRERAAMLIDAFQPRFAIEDMIAEGNRVVVRWTNAGTHVAPFMGIPATGRSYEIAGIDIYRVSDGRLAEHWHVVDMFGQMQQLGLLPAPQEA